MNFREATLMSDYRGRFRKTTLLALIMATFSLLLAIVLLSSSGQTFATRSFSLLLSLLCLALASLAALVALGGIIGLHRDALERAGQPSGTYATNVMGTLHVIESIRQTPSVRAAVIVTSDTDSD
jgi:hypothetical protein